MSESKYGIGDGLQFGFLEGITYQIIDRWLTKKLYNEIQN